MTREEAIKTIRLTCPKISDSECDFETAMRFLIPELRENEDEKIRKWLIHEIEAIYVTDGIVKNENADKALAWLEKQKESLHISETCKENADSFTDEDEAIRRKMIEHFKSKTKDTWCNMPVKSIISYLEKQKEQKSIQLNIKREYIEKRLKGLIDKEGEYCRGAREELAHLYYILGGEPSQYLINNVAKEEQKPGEDSEYRKAYLDGWNARNLQAAREQKPVEWSEEDEKMIDTIVSVLGQYIDYKTVSGTGSGYATPRYSKEIDFLKSLRPQPKQKRQIKEGDKVSIHCRKDRKEGIIAIYDGKVGEVIHVWDAKKHPWGHIIVKLDNGCNDGFYEDEIEVLDELSWKPSKEQMTNLLRAEGRLRIEGESVLASKLAELYEQLKKLIDK